MLNVRTSNLIKEQFQIGFKKIQVHADLEIPYNKEND